jgi:hypothetical protein
VAWAGPGRRGALAAVLALPLILGGCTGSASSRHEGSAAATTSTVRAVAPSRSTESMTRPSSRVRRPAPSSPAVVVADPRLAGLVGDGQFATVPLAFPATATGRPVAYAVQIEHGIPIDGRDFATQVHATLTDPRGWQGVDHITFAAASSPANATIIVTLATPRTTDQLCAPLDTGGWLSCWNQGRAVINSDRWFVGSVSYGSDLADYRHELVNHEVGHGLGHAHRYCPGPGKAAPVMQQQTISLQGCRANPWPSVTAG